MSVREILLKLAQCPHYREQNDAMAEMFAAVDNIGRNGDWIAELLQRRQTQEAAATEWRRRLALLPRPVKFELRPFRQLPFVLLRNLGEPRCVWWRLSYGLTGNMYSERLLCAEWLRSKLKGSPSASLWTTQRLRSVVRERKRRCDNWLNLARRLTDWPAPSDRFAKYLE